MTLLIDKLKEFNRNMLGIPRKIMLIAAVIISFLIVVKLLPILSPFILGYFISLLMRPINRFISGKFKTKKAKKLVCMLLMIILYTIIFVVFYLLTRQLVIEGINLAKNFPEMLNRVRDTFDNWTHQLVPVDVDGALALQQTSIQKTLSEVSNSALSFLQSSVSRLTPTVATGAISWISKVPYTILFAVMSIMSSFYFSMDREKISNYFSKTMPKDILNWFRGFSSNLGKATGKQIKAQILISLTISLALVLGFSLFKIEYAVLAGIVIGVLDVLPIIGAGTFLIPWGAFNLFSGNITLGGQILLMYIVVIVIRQIIEPKIVGKSLGLYPLVSMFSIYAGLKLLGFLGLLAGPILANICRAIILEDDKLRNSALPVQEASEKIQDIPENNKKAKK